MKGDTVQANAISALIQYDRRRRRLWILGQRCHHGATGAVLAALSSAGLISAKLTATRYLTVAGAAGLLMAHDWKDHAIWFEAGAGSQP